MLNLSTQEVRRLIEEQVLLMNKWIGHPYLIRKFCIRLLEYTEAYEKIEKEENNAK